MAGTELRLRLRLLACLLLLLLLVLAGFAVALPIVPDWSHCRSPRGYPAVNCCTLPDLMRPGGPLVYREWSEYLLRNPLPKQVRVRPAAHLAAANLTYIDQLHRAYKLMAELPHSDPRSHFQQVNLHCMYGSEGMEMQVGYPDQEYSVHYTWLFQPFHRMYTFFYERILAKLVDDENFVLPFWNWDNQTPLEPLAPNAIPPFYRNPEDYPALYHHNRDPRHLPWNPPILADTNYLNVKGCIYTDDPDELREANNARLHHYIAKPDAKFLSPAMHAGDELFIDTDNFEINIHGAVHYWMGHPEKRFLDMGLVYSAPLDPIFCSHHANVDRMWTIWKSNGGKEYSHPDFLNAPFFFYDENAELVRVTVADTLDHRPMMYDWQEVEVPWLTYNGSGTIDGISTTSTRQEFPSSLGRRQFRTTR